jgi:hypothetical protein
MLAWPAAKTRIHELDGYTELRSHHQRIIDIEWRNGTSITRAQSVSLLGV